MTTTYSQIANARVDLKDAQHVLRNKAAELRKTVDQISVLEANGIQVSNALINKKSQLETDINSARVTVESMELNLGTLIDDYLPPVAVNPGISVYDTESIENIYAKYPILMMPLKIETRFLDAQFTNASGTQTCMHLWVRVYPDDIWIQTLSDKITQEEYLKANEFLEINNADQVQKEIERKNFWMEWCNQQSPTRIAWTIEKAKQMNAAFAASNNDPLLDPETQDETIKSALFANSETIQPDATLLPERFRVYVYHRPVNTPVDYTLFDIADISVPGTIWNLKRDSLKVGIDQNFEAINGASPITINSTTHEVEINDNALKWMYDFEEAMKVGMAGRVSLFQLTNPEDYEFKVVVLGVKESKDINDSTKDLQELFNNHRFTKGMALLKQGSHTKNGETNYAGYSTFELDKHTIYKAECTEPQYSVSNDIRAKADGQILAEALGFPADFFDQIFQAGNKDINNAVRFNNVLWGAFGENYLRNLRGVNNSAMLNKARKYVYTYAMSRGRLPGFRIGNVPYGVIPIGKTDGLEALVDMDESIIVGKLKSELDNIEPIFKQAADNALIRPGSSDGKVAVVDMLGKHAVPQEIYARQAVGPGYMWNSYMFKGEQNEAQIWLDDKKTEALNAMQELGITGSIPLLFQLSYTEAHSLLSMPLVEIDLENDQLSLIPNTSVNYLQWIAEATIPELLAHDYTRFGAPANTTPPNNLLYTLVRQAILSDYWNVAADILGYDDEQRKFIELVNMLPEGNVPPEINFDELEGYEDFRIQMGEHKWAIFDKLVDRPDGNGSQIAIHEYISEGYLDTLAETPPESWTVLNRAKEDLGIIAVLNPNELDLLVVELIGLITYRFDAWTLSLIELHLDCIRNNATTKNATYIGAYGWVTGLMKQDTANENKGCIIAPSMSQAGAGALIKSAYKATNSNSTAAHKIDLSSERARKASRYVEGVNNGQSMSVLIGYEFERALHDVISPIMDKYIQPFRSAFPQPFSTVPDNNSLAETIAPRNVVNGLALLNDFRSNNNTPPTYSHLFGKISPQFISTIPNSERDIIVNILNEISDNIDALSDLAEAESAFQLVGGNYERASAYSAAISGSRNTPEAQVLQTPVDGCLITNKITYHFDNTAEGWFTNNIETFNSRRSYLEPGINNWVERLIPYYSDIEFKVQIGEDTPIYLTPFDLRLSAIDLLYLVNEDLSGKDEQIKKRILFVLSKTYEINDTVHFRFNESNSGKLAYDDIKLILLKAGSVLTASKPLNATHYYSPLADNSENNHPEFDKVEIINRLTTLKESITNPNLINLGNDNINLNINVAEINSVNQVQSTGMLNVNPGILGSMYGMSNPSWTYIDEVFLGDVVIKKFALNFSNNQSSIRLFENNFTINYINQDFTICFYVKIADSMLGNKSYLFIDKRTDPGLDLLIGINESGSLICNMADTDIVSSSENIADNQLHHITISKSNDQLNFIIDGVFVNSATIPAIMPPPTSSITTGIFLGKHPNIGSTSLVDFTIFNVTIWDIYLDEEAVATEIANTNSNTSDALVKWQLDDVKDAEELTSLPDQLLEVAQLNLEYLIGDTLPLNEVERYLFIKDKFTVVNQYLNVLSSQLNLPNESETSQLVLEKCTEIARLMLNKTFVVLPRFTFRASSPYNESGQIQKALQNSHSLLNCSEENLPLKMSQWLNGLSRVRNVVNDFELISNIVYASKGEDIAKLNPIQLPFRDTEDRWLAADFSDITQEALIEKLLETNKLCIASNLTLSGVGNVQCGIVIDEWTELIPLPEVKGGISFHYDKPFAKAPQALLLALPKPNASSIAYWKRNELCELLLDTLKLAILRAVDYEDLAPTDLNAIGSATLESNPNDSILFQL